MTSVIRTESLVFREVLGEDGIIRLSVSMEGDHETVTGDDVAGYAYAVAAASFALFTDGTVVKLLQEKFGITFDELRLEN